MKISLASFADALCHARRGSRLALARRLFSPQSNNLPPSTAEVCEFSKLADYARDYARLASILGHDGKTPPPGEIEFLNSLLHRPVRYPGTIAWSHCFFLTAFVSILAPGHVVEIGTLTGFSAAVIAAALSRRHGGENSARVDTIDVRAQCLIDETRPTGFEIAELIPDLTAIVRLHIPHDSSFISQLAKENELKVVFIDADHRHPRPLLDLLRLAPYMASAGWILLHDIRLGTTWEKLRASGRSPNADVPYGAEWLFDKWPFRKISGGNIGAVQLPGDKSELVPFALTLMTVAFEIGGKESVRARRALYRSFGQLLQRQSQK